jgi:hypothetical protein
MSFEFIGALVGLAFAVAEYFLFGSLIAKAHREGNIGQGPRVLDLVRKAQLIIFPLIGWFAGSFFSDPTGVP